MPTCATCQTASRSPIHRFALVTSLAVIAAATLVLWQPSGPLPTVTADSAAPAITVAALHIQAT